MARGPPNGTSRGDRTWMVGRPRSSTVVADPVQRCSRGVVSTLLIAIGSVLIHGRDFADESLGRRAHRSKHSPGRIRASGALAGRWYASGARHLLLPGGTRRAVPSSKTGMGSRGRRTTWTRTFSPPKPEIRACRLRSLSGWQATSGRAGHPWGAPDLRQLEGLLESRPRARVGLRMRDGNRNQRGPWPAGRVIASQWWTLVHRVDRLPYVMRLAGL